MTGRLNAKCPFAMRFNQGVAGVAVDLRGRPLDAVALG
jgi:hypothetical protein